MIEIENQAWDVMVRHAEATYPTECCGVMIGSIDGENKLVREARGLENAYTGGQEDRYEIRPADLLQADRDARISQRAHLRPASRRTWHLFPGRMAFESAERTIGAADFWFAVSIWASRLRARSSGRRTSRDRRRS